MLLPLTCYTLHIKAMPHLSLTDASLALACGELAQRDPDLARVLAQFGVPPLWARPAGFATLVHIILEQQVSLASARSAFEKLRAALGAITPEKFLTLDDAQLKTIGFSRQKTLYCRELALAVLDGSLDIDGLPDAEDDLVRHELKKIKGIGDWTADIYLLMVLCRPDILPRGDLALLIALKELKQLPARPSHDEFLAIAENWQPHRAVAARILWHHYLSTPRKRTQG